MLTAVSMMARCVRGMSDMSRSVIMYRNSNMLSSVLSSNMSTYNQAEVDKFSAMSSDWWNPSGVCAPLHSFNKLRIPLVRDGLISSGLVPESENPATPLANTNILDVGCGAGIVSEPLARLGATVTGIDACQQNIEVARHHSNLDPGIEDRLNYLCTTVEEFRERDGDKYDAVVASEVIEHVDNPNIFVNNCAELLKPGGSLFITTLNRTTRSWLLAILGAEYILGLLPKGTHSWDKFLTPEEVTDMVEKAGLVTRQTSGMSYIPVVNSWCWTQDHSVNYMLQAVKM